MTFNRFLWRFFRYQQGPYLLYAGTNLLISLLLLLPGLIARRFFDTLTGASPPDISVPTFAVLLVTVELTRWALRLASGQLGILAGFTGKAMVRVNCMRQILRQPGAQALPVAAGDAMNRLLSDGDALDLFLTTLLTLGGQCLFALAALAMMLTINRSITLLVVLPLVAVIAAAQLAGARFTHFRQASREASGRVNGAINEMFGAVQAIKVANAEEHVIAHFARLNVVRRRAGLQERLFTTTMTSVFGGSVTLGTGLILLVAAQAMRMGGFSVGDFALFVSYLGMLGDAIRMAGAALAGAKQAAVSFQRLEALMAGAPAEALVTYGPVYLRGPQPVLASPVRAQAKCQRLTVTGLAYHLPRDGARHQRHRPHHRARLVHRHHRAGRGGQDDAAAGLARPATPRRGRDSLERPGD
jgi:ATP-binding cassette, subfamily B, bacterial